MSETHWKKLTNPNYLGAWDFSTGEERLLSIDKVILESVTDMEKGGSAKKDCVVAHFKENCKPMILNKTNCKMIQNLYNTPIIENWTGKQVIVKVEKVKAFGKLEDALRIKKEKPSNTVRPHICHDCKKEVRAFDKYTVGQIADTNRKRYGVDLCAGCSSIRKSNESEANNNDNHS